MDVLALIASVFGVIFIAELPDKTALAALVLATRQRPLPVFVGAALALTIQSLVAIAAGQLLTMLPTRPVHVVAGVVFLVSAVLMWRRKSEDDAPPDDGNPHGFWRVSWASFVVIFIAEWGDLTQLATAALAARYAAPIPVFIGATAALWAVTAIAVFIGHRAGKLLDPHITQKVAAVLFALVGVALVAGIF